jgi:hypothetical protein
MRQALEHDAERNAGNSQRRRERDFADPLIRLKVSRE